MKAKKFFSFLVIIATMVFLPVGAMAFTVNPFYAGSYAAFDLGSVPGVPAPYGMLLLKPGDPNTLLIGGNANNASGAVYAIGLTRGVGNHITGFSGTASFFAAAAYIDGGGQYGPGGVLFLPRFPVNELGQTKPGSTITDKIVDMGALGVAPSAAVLAFVPPGSPGAGQLKLLSWGDGEWYTLVFTPDVSGTFDITAATLNVTLWTDSEGIAYVPPGSPLFASPSVLIAEWTNGKVASYEVDANGNPIVATRKEFITDLIGAEGASIDPLTGDFIFSTFGTFFGGDHFVVVQDFTPSAPIPVPPTVLLLGSGLLGLVGWRSVKRKAL